MQLQKCPLVPHKSSPAHYYATQPELRGPWTSCFLINLQPLPVGLLIAYTQCILFYKCCMLKNITSAIFFFFLAYFCSYTVITFCMASRPIGHFILPNLGRRLRNLSLSDISNQFAVSADCEGTPQYAVKY